MDMEVDHQQDSPTPSTTDVPAHIPNKIRFKEDVIATSNNVTCEFYEHSKCTVDLGLLTEGNLYEVRFFMSHRLGNGVEIPPLQSPAVTVTDLKKFEGRRGHRVTLEVKCSVDGVFHEELVFVNEQDEKVLLTLHAKVMRPHIGTPALKGGIKLLSKFSDDMSETNTDWEGFG